LHNKHWIQDGITWTMSRFLKKGIEFGITWTLIVFPQKKRTKDGLYLDYITVLVNNKKRHNLFKFIIINLLRMKKSNQNHG